MQRFYRPPTLAMVDTTACGTPFTPPSLCTWIDQVDGQLRPRPPGRRDATFAAGAATGACAASAAAALKCHDPGRRGCPTRAQVMVLPRPRPARSERRSRQPASPRIYFRFMARVLRQSRRRQTGRHRPHPFDAKAEAERIIESARHGRNGCAPGGRRGRAQARRSRELLASARDGLSAAAEKW